jgi:hypothetical protein
MVTPHNLSEPETIGLSVPPGGGNFSLIVGMSFDEAPMGWLAKTLESIMNKLSRRAQPRIRNISFAPGACLRTQ